jgi:hypothetical protein
MRHPVLLFLLAAFAAILAVADAGSEGVHAGSPFVTLRTLAAMNHALSGPDLRCTGLDEGRGDAFRHFSCIDLYDGSPLSGKIAHTTYFAGKPTLSESYDTTWSTVNNGRERWVRRTSRGRAPSVLIGLPHFLAAHVEVLARTHPRRQMEISVAITCVTESNGRWVTRRKSFRAAGPGWVKRYVVLPKSWAGGYCMSGALATSRRPTALTLRLTTHE